MSHWFVDFQHSKEWINLTLSRWSKLPIKVLVHLKKMWFGSFCNFINVLILRKMHIDYVFSNLHVIKDLHEAVFA